VTRLPVRWRLTLAFALVMAVVLAATGCFVHERQESALDGAIDGALRARADDVAALAQQSESGLREARPGASGRRPEVAQLIDGSGAVLDRSPGVSARPLVSPGDIAEARSGHAVIREITVAGDEPVRLLAEPVEAQGQHMVVVVGQSLEERDRALSDLAGVLLLGGPAALLLASLAGHLLTGAALRPVDAMVERVRASVARERTFFSDASHELRSPLAMLRTELELMGRERPSGPALQTAVGSAVEETDRLTRLADDLLLLARADDHQLVLHRGDASAAELLHEAAGRARRHAAATGVEIIVDAPPDARVDVDRDRIAQALDNLVANALRHADATVALSARAEQRLVELHVSDDGPGFPPEFLPRAWERFARADAARTGDGVGLGLAIVRAIAAAHGGRADAANRTGGGADVWISVP
jgi:two-component system OmpR family sensor kinase